MEPLIKTAWLFLCALHVAPAAAAFRPSVIERLYGVDPGGTAGLLLAHRGVLFLVVALLAGFAAFAPEARRVASLGVGVSVAGFLVLFVRAGAPDGALRGIALADAAALLPLALVAYAAWRG